MRIPCFRGALAVVTACAAFAVTAGSAAAFHSVWIDPLGTLATWTPV